METNSQSLLERIRREMALRNESLRASLQQAADGNARAKAEWSRRGVELSERLTGQRANPGYKDMFELTGPDPLPNDLLRAQADLLDKKASLAENRAEALSQEADALRQEATQKRAMANEYRRYVGAGTPIELPGVETGPLHFASV